MDDARSWSTPGTAALAFENLETGDGRIFAPKALIWDGPGPWPLQYVEAMEMGHQGAELAGAIHSIARRGGGRITGKGVLFSGLDAGADALTLLEEEAPLGVSVDLDDVSMELVDRSGSVTASMRLPQVSMLRLTDGWAVTATAVNAWTAAGDALTRTAASVQLQTGPDGALPADAVQSVFGTAGMLTASAGDPDDELQGEVLYQHSSGDLLMRITRGRVRGATLVAMPAFADARIVLDKATASTASTVQAAGAVEPYGPTDTHYRVVEYIRTSPTPERARRVATALGLKLQAARDHLNRAVKAGKIVRIGRGLYTGRLSDERAVHPSKTGVMPDGLEASAWSALKDADPLPAAWFREPSPQELPPGSGGVHYKDGRIFGWVAQAGEPHAGFPGRNLTIESLGAIDTTHFLRSRWRLDDGSTVKAGAFTMNVGHHRDGAECETEACQFDDTRTVAGIITVGMNSRGMWFSGAASPFLSEWDRSVFRTCQPSYHMIRGGDGRYQLRGVLSVPVPGHSSALAAAVVERSNLALAASAAAQDSLPAGGEAAGRDPADVEALLDDPDFIDRLAAALESRGQVQDKARAEVAQMMVAVLGPGGVTGDS